MIDGDTLEAVLPSSRSCKIRIEGFDAPEAPTPQGRDAKHALESLLEAQAHLPLTAFLFLPEDKDEDGILDLDELMAVLSFERIRAYLFAGSIRVDLWMREQGHQKA